MVGGGGGRREEGGGGALKRDCRVLKREMAED